MNRSKVVFLNSINFISEIFIVTKHKVARLHNHVCEGLALQDLLARVKHANHVPLIDRRRRVGVDPPGLRLFALRHKEGLDEVGH